MNLCLISLIFRTLNNRQLLGFLVVFPLGFWVTFYHFLTLNWAFQNFVNGFLCQTFFQNIMFESFESQHLLFLYHFIQFDLNFKPLLQTDDLRLTWATQ